jgi:hypothetical protein
VKQTDYALSRLFFDLQNGAAAADYRADRATVLDRYDLAPEIRAAVLADDIAEARAARESISAAVLLHRIGYG